MYMYRYSLTHYPAGGATSDNIKREVYRWFERICNASGHLHECSAIDKEIEPSKLFDIYSYQTKIFYPVVSAALGEKRLRRDKMFCSTQRLITPN